MIFNMSSVSLKTPVLNASYPANTTVNSGTNATFKVEISEAGIPASYTYQWYVNNTAVSGATSASYTRSTSSDKGTYSVYCKVTNSAGSVTSRAATLTVNKTPVLSTSYPANTSVVFNTAVTSKVTISTAGYPTTYTYQWYKNGSAVSGATSSTYTFTPTAIGTTTLYCKVTNAAGSVTSRTATITATGAYIIKDGKLTTSPFGSLTQNLVGHSSATLTYSAEHGGLYLYIGKYGTSYSKGYVAPKINVTNYSTLVVTWKTHGYSGRVGFVETVNTAAQNQTYVAGVVDETNRTNNFSAVRTDNIDISSLSGEYTFCFSQAGSQSGGYTGGLVVQDAYLK